jgi:hypothetical protein
MQTIWKLEYIKDGKVSVYEGFKLKDSASHLDGKSVIMKNLGHYIKMNVILKDGVPSHTLPRVRNFSYDNMKSLEVVKN